MKQLEDSDTARRSVAEIAYDSIADRITSGEFGARERITEAQLVKELGVSRGAAREAMSKLAADGLIELELFKGAIVRALSRRDLADFLQVRGMFESFAAKRAAERINEPGLRELAYEIIEQCNAIEAGPSSEGMIANDTNFHSAIMDMAGNSIMAAEWRRLRKSRFRIGFLRSLNFDEVLESVRQHREVMYAIIEGNGDLAAELAHKHVQLTNSRIQRLTNERFDAIFNPPGLAASNKKKLSLERSNLKNTNTDS